MLSALYNYFSQLFEINMNGSDLYEYGFEIFGGYMSLHDYFALICSIVSLIFIVVLCCLFVWKIIKLIGGLIR